MIKPFDFIVSDIEGDGLYQEVTQLHCAVAICADTGAIRRFGPLEIGDYLKFIQGRFFIGHNILDYDLPSLTKLFGYDWRLEDACDTLVMSRLLNPERRGGHSLGSWGEALGCPKMDWRLEAEKIGLICPGDPKGAEFRVFHPRMLDYNEQDCVVNRKVLFKLLEYLGWTLEDLRVNLRGFKIG